MNRKAIGRILFTFSCMIAMVLVFGLQASDMHAYALSGGTRYPSYVAQNVEWTGFGSGTYIIEYGGNTGMFTSKPTKPTNGKLTVKIGANISQNPTSRTGYIYAKQYNSTAKTYVRVATLTVVQSGHTHSWPSAWNTRKTATCTADGIKYRNCAVCGKEDTAVIPRTGHTNQPWTVTKQPTCGAAGEETRKCTKCGATETRTYGAPTGKHIYGSWRITEQPTCTKAGTETRYCDRCMHFETRATGRCGHVYRQINRTDPSWTCFKPDELIFQCDRCHGLQEGIESKCDIILCYERYNSSDHSLRKQADSLFNYKMREGNYSVDTYMVYYSTSEEYYACWNQYMPQKVRNIYDYGHEYDSFSHEFYGERVYFKDIIQGKAKPLNQKKVLGSVYIFTCNAGTTVWSDFCANYPLPTLYCGQYSSLRYYATVCPDAYVIGMAADNLDYDVYDKATGVLLPTPHCFELGGQFVAEYYDSAAKKFSKTTKLGQDIRATNFLELYL